VRLPALFSDNMVLQRGMKVPVWGWADPGGYVTVSIGKRQVRAVAGEDARWFVRLPSLPVDGPYEMSIRGEQTITLSNVMVGDVWLCSGQSNMQMTLQPGPYGVLDAEREVASANYPNIRLFAVPSATSFTPVDDVSGATWQVCGPQTVSTFSAAAYFFGREIHERLGVPIGLIHASRGASPAEAWTSARALRSLPDFEQVIEDLPDMIRRSAALLPEYEKKTAQWEAALDDYDTGYRDGRAIWAEPCRSPGSS